MSVLGQSLNLLSSILTISILLTRPNNNILLCYSNEPFLTVYTSLIGDVHTHYQGRIEPPKAARGHATSNSANIDSLVLNVTKDRGTCAACNTAHTIEVLISIFYMYTLTVST